MKGKFYLLISSILIIAGALVGTALNLLSVLPVNYYTTVLQVAWYIFCALLFISGIIGIIDRSKPATICIILGIILTILAVGSIPLMFLIGQGSAPAVMVVSGLLSIVVFGIYLDGAVLNKKCKPHSYYSLS